MSGTINVKVVGQVWPGPASPSCPHAAYRTDAKFEEERLTPGNRLATVNEVLEELKISPGSVHHVIYGVLQYRSLRQVGTITTPPLPFRSYKNVDKLTKMAFYVVESLGTNTAYITSGQRQGKPVRSADVLLLLRRNQRSPRTAPSARKYSNSFGTVNARS